MIDQEPKLFRITPSFLFPDLFFSSSLPLRRMRKTGHEDDWEKLMPEEASWASLKQHQKG